MRELQPTNGQRGRKRSIELNVKKRRGINITRARSAPEETQNIPRIRFRGIKRDSVLGIKKDVQEGNLAGKGQNAHPLTQRKRRCADIRHILFLGWGSDGPPPQLRKRFSSPDRDQL